MSDESIERVLHWMRDNASAYGKSCGDVTYLAEFIKSKKSILEIEAAELHSLKTGQEREAYARSHPDYIALIQSLGVATEEKERIKVLLKVADTKIDVWRTQRADERAERKAYDA